MVFCQAIADITAWIIISINLIGTSVAVITIIRVSKRDKIIDIEKKLKPLEKEIDKKANKEWVLVEIEKMELLNSDFRDEQNTKYNNICDRIEDGNSVNKQILERIEANSEEFKKLAIGNYTDIQVIKERINN